MGYLSSFFGFVLLLLDFVVGIFRLGFVLDVFLCYLLFPLC